MAHTAFQENIAALDFSFKESKEEGGVLLTSSYDNKTISPQELFAIETAKIKFGADAVYFRYFNDGRGAIPQIYLYDNTSNYLTDSAKRDIHIKVWSGCQVPIFIIVEKSQVQIFDAREKVKQNVGVLAIETIKLTGSALKNFSAKSFDDGLFWEEKENEKRFQFETSAYRELIIGLKGVYADFQKKSGLNSHVALKLLVQCLLIKYLEERDEQSENGYFAKTYFKSNFDSNNFCEVINSGKLLDLLDKLAEDFNGKIFEWHKDEESDERLAIQKSEVQKLADYLDGKMQNNQFVIWRLYSFSHLPVELISSVYEELLTNSKDIVYTPEMIVSTLVDECMPLKNPKKDFRLIDVSCGSGIFLVKAYKRVIQWWRYENWLETGVLAKPSLTVLTHLLTNSIYGRDVEGDAVRLSVFSLALALLDEVNLDPPTWQKLKFPDLGNNNIVESDFFKFISEEHPINFDLVIGNPPFNPPKDEEGKQPSNGFYLKGVKEKYNYSTDIKIPDDNLALHFMVKAMGLLKPDALLCLIQPSGPLMYQKDEDFKTSVFAKYNLLQIIDFTRLSDVLWGKRTIATAAIFLQNSLPTNEDVLHLICNRTFANVNKLFLEFDHYDFHNVSKASTLKNSSIWKSNLLGGGRIVNLIERLSSLSTLATFLKEKKGDGWVKGEGFIEKGDKNLADYITGNPFLPTEYFSEEGINWEKTEISESLHFHRPRAEKLYSSPHLLIRKIIGKRKLVTEYTEKYITFLSDIYAIHSPQSQKDELQKLAKYLDENGDLLRFYILSTSSRAKVNKATSLYDEDILHIPYPKDIESIKLSRSEKFIVDDALDYIFPSDSEKRLNVFACEKDIKGFSEVFCETLNTVYRDNDKNFRLFKILDAGKYFALHFEYTDKNIDATTQVTEDLEQYINEIIPTERRNKYEVHIQKVLKVFAKDTIIIAKPKRLKYWINSTAFRDADETFSDYFKARHS